VFGSPDIEVKINIDLINHSFIGVLCFFFVKEGPYTCLKDDEFFDALDQSLDRIDRETDNYQRLVRH